ncbi:uncharacterized protein LOC144018079 [Festucalex cinctus]
MEASFQLLDNFSLEGLLDKSYPLYDPDPGYFSAGLSPTSSEDSFSPNLALDSFFLGSPAPVKKSRSRYPGKKRQTASEREKLRMRDLTKALHQLRSYLPPSGGQTLTKIQTLHLAARYIAFLSAQLGLSEEVLEHRRRSGRRRRPSEPAQTLSQFLGQREESGEQANANRIFDRDYGCQFPSNVSFDDAQQCWLPQQQLHDFSGQCWETR